MIFNVNTLNVCLLDLNDNSGTAMENVTLTFGKLKFTYVSVKFSAKALLG